MSTDSKSAIVNEDAKRASIPSFDRASSKVLPALELRGTRYSSGSEHVSPEDEPNGLPPTMPPKPAPIHDEGARLARFTGPQDETIEETPSSQNSIDSGISSSSSISINGSGSNAMKSLMAKSKLQKARAKSEMPAIDELTTELNITAEHLESCKRQTYQRTFRLWMPMVHDFNADTTTEEDELAEMMTEVLPVDELLDRVMLRRVRVSAVERSIVFLFFNFIYCTCLIMQRSLSDSFELESALKTQVDAGRIRFSTDITNVNSVWDWMETSLTDNLSPATAWYNGDAMVSEDLGYTSYYNKQCGGFSLVQHRVTEYSSKMYTPFYQDLYPVVWPDLGTAASTSKTVQGMFAGDDHHSFGPPHDIHKYKWTPDSSGEFQGGGFTIHFPTDKKMILYKLAELRADRFIDKQTRKLQFIITVFNANLKLFAVMDFQVMFNAAGEVSTEKIVSSVRINHMVDFVDYIRVFMEVLLVVLMVMHSREEFKTARKVGFANYLNFWNAIDAARQAIFYSCTVAYVVLMTDPLRQHPERVEGMCNGENWINFPRLAKMEEDYVFNSSMCLLLSTLLIFKFLTPFPKFGIFVHTMVAAGKDLFNFVLILCILLFGFAVIGHLLFGHVMSEYSTVSLSFESAVLNAIGVFDYPAMVDASTPLAASIYFFSFVFIITMVVMQMVIAIIFSAYDSLREQIDDAEELEIGPTLTRKVLLGRGPSLKELHEPLLEVAKKGLRARCARLSKSLFKWMRTARAKDGASVVPEREGEEMVTPDKFSDEHLLQLFDPQHVFRFYGILNPKVEETIVQIKVLVAKERENASKDLTPQQKMARVSSVRTTATSASGEAAQQKIADSWALDRQEFCALLMSLDNKDTQLHITHDVKNNGGSRSEEPIGMLIAHHIFTAYGRKNKASGEEGKFRKRVTKKLNKLIKLVESPHENANERFISGDYNRRVVPTLSHQDSSGVINASFNATPQAADVASKISLARKYTSLWLQKAKKPPTAFTDPSHDASNVMAVKRNSRHRLSVLQSKFEASL